MRALEREVDEPAGHGEYDHPRYFSTCHERGKDTKCAFVVKAAEYVFKEMIRVDDRILYVPTEQMLDKRTDEFFGSAVLQQFFQFLIYPTETIELATLYDC